MNKNNRTTGLGVAVLGAAALFASALSAEASQGECNSGLAAKLAGQYVGEQTGFRSVLNVASPREGTCEVEARWETYNERAPLATGVVRLVLEGGVLTGDWRAGQDTGQARFDVLRNGDLLNGRMMGIKGVPDGSWDYIKSEAK